MSARRAATKRQRKQRPGAQGTVRERLDQAESTLRAIRSGEVDALVVSGPRGERTLLLDGAARPYFVLLDAMSDGALLLERDGAILFANRSAGRLAGTSPDELRGSPFAALAIPAQRERLADVVRASVNRTVREEFLIGDGTGWPTPVSMTLTTLRLQQGPGASRRRPAVLMAILTDLTTRKRAETMRARLLDRVMSAEEDERRRIARELHDETGQSLTALLVGLRAITEMSDDKRADIRTAARRLRRIAARTVDDVARLARGLHPAALDETGLSVAARRHTEDFARAMGMAVTFSARGVDRPRLPPLVAATAYRILQEALTNVARHALATKVRVTLSRDPSGLHVVVQDDGVGFDTASADTQEGLGLHGMRERASLLGGAIAIESRLGQGTVVSAHIPITSPKKPRARGERSRRKRPAVKR